LETADNVSKTIAKNVTLEPNYSSPNQKFDLIGALFRNGCANEAIKLMKHLDDFKPASSTSVSSGFCRYLHSQLDHLYPSKFRLLSNRPSSGDSISQTDVITNLGALLPALQLVSPFLCRDPTLLSKICRITERGIQPTTGSDKDKILKGHLEFVDELLCTVLIPSLSMCECNIGLTSDVYSIMKFYNYEQRFTWYSFWRGKVYESTPELRAVRASVRKSLTVIDRRITSGSDRNREFGRQLIRVAHSNPVISLEHLLKKVQVCLVLFLPHGLHMSSVL
jgi:hypothetical protein